MKRKAKKTVVVIDFVICPECGNEQADMGRNVRCEECGCGPMPYNPAPTVPETSNDR